MIINILSNGDFKTIVPENVYQGSNDANTIYLIAPFSANIEALISFEIPQTEETTEEYRFNPPVQISNELNVWTLNINKILTQYFGRLKYQIKMLSGTQIVATASGIIPIKEGVPFELPPQPTEDVYQLILQNLSDLKSLFINGWIESQGLKIYNSEFSYSLGTIVVDANGNEFDVYQSKVSANKGNPLTDTNSWQKLSVDKVVDVLVDGVSVVENKVARLDSFAKKTDLDNYYTKQETYNKAEVNDKISQVEARVSVNENDIENLKSGLQTTNNKVQEIETNLGSTTNIANEALTKADESLGKVNNAVLFTPQTLSDTQKAQARENIGAGSATSTSVYVGGEYKSQILFNSDPQTQITQAVNRIAVNENNIETLTNGLQETDNKVVENTNDIDALENSVVKFTAQTLTEQQKQQARNNIGAGTGSEIQVIDNLESTSATDALSANQGRVLSEKIKDIELFKFPNAVIIGEPIINNGQVSNFSTANYMMFPFILDVQNRPFQVDFCFTTGTDVTTQQNILDSKFGIALAIKDGKGLMAISNNGTSWTSTAVGNLNIQPNTTYYARLTWNRLIYKTQLSTNGTTYVDDMSVTNATKPYPETIYIGGGSVEALGHSSTPFFGTINMNKAFLYLDGQLIWQGMDDAGLATRADVSLSNLDSAGINKIKEVVVENVSNPNLLINGDFRVNQRGQTNYTESNKYCVDRWKLISGTVEIVSNGIILNGTITQTLEHIPNQNVIASSSAGTISYDNGIVTLSTSESVLINFAKLEIGSVATPFSPRPYAEELVMCQRYYQKLYLQGTAFFPNSTSTGYPAIQTTQIMRNAITISVLQNANARGYGAAKDIDSLTYHAYLDNKIRLLATRNNADLAGNQTYVFATGQIAVDAEIY